MAKDTVCFTQLHCNMSVYVIATLYSTYFDIIQRQIFIGRQQGLSLFFVGGKMSPELADEFIKTGGVLSFIFIAPRNEPL